MVSRLPVRFMANHKKVLMQYFYIESRERLQNIVSRVRALSDEEKAKVYQDAIALFSARHKNFDTLLENNFNRLNERLSLGIKFDTAEGRLLAAYFSKEYSTQSAALFNPSIVRHPQQAGVDEGELRILLSLRATGESHISSIAFREGKILNDGTVLMEADSPYCVSPVKHQGYFHERLASNPAMIESNYDIEFSGDESITERVIFPLSPAEMNGIEDVRFVEFSQEDGARKYLGTYTAYNGRRVSPMLIETADFKKFEIRSLHGRGAIDKGKAIFPRKINGQYVICSRIDGENLFIMRSDDLYTWDNSAMLRSPKLPWEFIQLGNCGSPIETPEGWLLITHAVGAFRRYVLSALLLDKENPEKVIAALDAPLIEPDESEREGYVPNVVYSCGSLLYGDELYIPYAMSDSVSGMATCKLTDLLQQMKKI